MNNSVSGMDPQVPQVTQVLLVGEEFVAGPQGNAELDLLLGHKTVLCGNLAVRSDDGHEIAPNYCSDQSLTLSILEQMQVFPLVLETTHAGKRPSKGFTQEHVATFVIGEQQYLTKPQQTASAAVACALWYCLADKSPLID